MNERKQPGDWRGYDDAAHRADADATIRHVAKTRPDIIERLIKNNKPGDEAGIRRIMQVLGLTK